MTMYVYMYICAYVCTRVCVVFMCLHMLHLCVCVYMCLCVCVCVVRAIEIHSGRKFSVYHTNCGQHPAHSQ